MTDEVKRIAVTGGAGQIAYSLLFRIANGEIFGKEQPLALHILERPQALESLKGVVMELEDSGFPLLQEIKVGSDANEIFEGVNVAILLGAKPRGPGMERRDLLAENGQIFVEQGRALNRSAASNALVFVVGNPCNTNCLIAMHHAPNISKGRFHAMTMLDQNRARYQIAQKAGVLLTDVENITIWGNHSATLVPDTLNATIRGKSVSEVIFDRNYLEVDFIKMVQKRGAAIIHTRGKSSAASAASAIVDGIRAISGETEPDRWFSSAILSDGNPYGVAEGLIFSFPCRAVGGEVKIVEGLKWDSFLKERIALTEKELIEERETVAHLLT
jgi:malate dehydrogenase